MPATRPVKICIVTPTYNAAAYLESCLESVANQRVAGLEVEHLILDGGSTDGTLDILATATVTRLPRDPGSGLLEAMCHGFQAADGDLVGFLGADDLYLPGALNAVAECYRAEQRPVIFCRARWCDAQLRSLGELAPPPRWLSASMHSSLGWNYIGAASSFLTSSLYRDLGGFDREFHKAEDYELFTRILAKRIPYSTLDQAVCVYRRHGRNDSLVHDDRYHHDLARVRDLYCPTSRWQQALLGNLFKTWIYVRNPAWSYHQLKRKLMSARLRG
jgi:glycosyltransferase involved in cell wall biosynthesis